jgi:hypothetical protein
MLETWTFNLMFTTELDDLDLKVLLQLVHCGNSEQELLVVA